MEHVEVFPYKIRYGKFKPFRNRRLEIPNEIMALYIEPHIKGNDKIESHTFKRAYLIKSDGKYVFNNLYSLWHFIIRQDSAHIYTLNTKYILPLMNIKEIAPLLNIKIDIYKVSKTYFAKITNKDKK
jgi:hypothetical protein